MKRAVFTFFVCLLGVWAEAQATCELRVDAHPRATTKQRVDYCLTNSRATGVDRSGLTFFGVRANYPAQQTTTVQEPSARAGYFEQDKMVVGRMFVDAYQFPRLKNETLSEQEMWERHFAAVEQAEKAAQQARVSAEKQEEPSTQVTETKAGLQARRKKPSRKLRAIVEEEVSSPVTDLSEVVAQEEVTPVAAEYTYDDYGAQSYMPATPDAQEYVPAEQTAQPYELEAPETQEEILVGASAYAPAG